jgi:hypothetical protein
MPMFFSGLVLFIICVSGISILGTVFWIWMLVDCVMNKKISDMQKALWVLLIVFTHFIGALIYFFVGRSMQSKQGAYQYYTQPQASYQNYEAPREASYRSYGQGYQAPPAPPHQRNDAPPIYSEGEHAQRQQLPPDYEQPQAMYPQNPSEQ